MLRLPLLGLAAVVSLAFPATSQERVPVAPSSDAAFIERVLGRVSVPSPDPSWNVRVVCAEHIECATGALLVKAGHPARLSGWDGVQPHALQAPGAVEGARRSHFDMSLSNLWPLRLRLAQLDVRGRIREVGPVAVLEGHEELQAAVDGGVLALRCSDPADVIGELVDAQGEPLPGAVVAALDRADGQLGFDPERTRIAVADGAGRFRVPVPSAWTTYDLFLLPSEGLPQLIATAEAPVRRGGGAAWGTRHVVATERAFVHVRLRDAAGEPVALDDGGRASVPRAFVGTDEELPGGWLCWQAFRADGRRARPGSAWEVGRLEPWDHGWAARGELAGQGAARCVGVGEYVFEVAAGEVVRLVATTKDGRWVRGEVAAARAGGQRADLVLPGGGPLAGSLKVKAPDSGDSLRFGGLLGDSESVELELVDAFGLVRRGYLSGGFRGGCGLGGMGLASRNESQRFPGAPPGDYVFVGRVNGYGIRTPYGARFPARIVDVPRGREGELDLASWRWEREPLGGVFVGSELGEAFWEGRVEAARRAWQGSVLAEAETGVLLAGGAAPGLWSHIEGLRTKGFRVRASVVREAGARAVGSAEARWRRGVEARDLGLDFVDPTEARVFLAPGAYQLELTWFGQPVATAELTTADLEGGRVPWQPL